MCFISECRWSESTVQLGGVKCHGWASLPRVLQSGSRLVAAAVLSIFFCAGWVAAQSVDDYHRQALTLAGQQRLLEALEVVEQGLKRFPDAPELLLQHGALLLKLGRVTEGQKTLERALIAAPQDARILSKTAESEMRQGRLDRAIELFREALIQGSGGDANYQLAYTLFLKGDDPGALEQARQAVQAEPLEPRFRLFLATLLNLQRQPEEAARQLMAAYRLDPHDPHTLYRLSSMEQSRGSLGRALEFAELAQRLDAENPLYQRRLAKLYRAAGEADLSRRWEERAEQLERAFHSYARALRLVKQSRLTEATLVLEEVTQKNAEFVSGWMALADLYQKRGLEQLALTAYLTALERDPGQRQAKEAGAFIRLRQGSLDLALELLRPSEDQDLNQGLLQGYQFMLDRRWQDALDLFATLSEAYPLSIDLIRLMSFCASELGHQSEALEMLARAQSLQPQDEEIERFKKRLLFEKAVELEESGQWRQAALQLQELVIQDPASGDYRLRLAYSLQQQGELSAAVEHYRLGLLTSPGEVWARKNLASSLYRLQRYEAAAREWTLLLENEETPENLLQLGLCFSHLGREQEAETVLARAVQLSASPELIYNLGITRLRLLKVEEAWKLLREAARLGYPPAEKLVRQYAQK